jgi:nicotinamide riboside kinase
MARGPGVAHMKVLVLTGPESSGKSWLSAELQAHFGGILVGEYVRRFIEQNPRDTSLADIPTIARGQLQWEDEARALQPPLLILDTHLLSNILWSQTLFGDCPGWIEQALLARQYDLHLLLSPENVEWTDDGQRCQPELVERQVFFNDIRAWLEQHGQPVQVLCGDWSERRAQALTAVAMLLGLTP